MRHNMLRDAEANFMRQVCKDVAVEPELLPIGNERRAGNTAEKARLDISARGVWSICEKSFFDVRVTYPAAPSQLAKPIKSIYREHENQKKNAYNDRVLQTEKSSFTPLVFSTSGGMGPECQRLNKRLAELIASKQKEVYSHVISHIRCTLRFALLRATLVAVRGVRGKSRCASDLDGNDNLSFNLIPQEQAYEGF